MRRAGCTSHPTMPGHDDLGGAVSFARVWTERIVPALADVYHSLLAAYPSRLQARFVENTRKKEEKEKKMKGKKNETAASALDLDDRVQEKMEEVLREVERNGETRNVYLNLAWTAPIDNTKLLVKISFDKVANMALDMFCDTSKHASTGEPQVTAASGVEEAGEAESFAALAALDGAARATEKIWRIPGTVEKGFEIPIAITNCTAVPALGHFKRLGMDPVVNAVWLALFWAIEEQHEAAASALKRLILDWPMDFVRIDGDTPEEI